MLLTVLPRTGVALFGISGADPNVLSQFTATIDVPLSYPDALIRLLTWNTGETLDGIQASTALVQAIEDSLPTLLIGATVTAIGLLLGLLRPNWLRWSAVKLAAEFLAFIPAFLPPVVALSALVIAGSGVVNLEPWTRYAVVGICVGLIPGCLVMVAIRSTYEIELRKNYVTTMRAFGLTERRIGANVRKAIILQLFGMGEKIVTMQITVLIFTEAVLSVPGFGTTLLLSVQRTDINLILIFVFAISMLVAVTRLVGTFVLAAIEIRQSTEAVRDGTR